MEKLEPSYTAGGNVKWCCSHFGTAVVAQKIKPYDPTIPFIGMIPKRTENKYPKICAHVFLAALFIIAKSGNNCWIWKNYWKQNVV